MNNRIRECRLPAGWYPSGREETQELLASWCCSGAAPPVSQAVVVPHAGWTYSGRLAFDTLSSLDCRGTVVVVGGHLSADAPVLVAFEDAYATPLGTIPVDKHTRGCLVDALNPHEDTDCENSVEVLLPMLKYLNPELRIVWVRVGPDIRKVETTIHALMKAAEQSDESLTVVGSTDLTHYGPRFAMDGHGTGDEAHRWVREENDAPLLKCMAALDYRSILSQAQRDRSACSAGAAAVAVGYARAGGCDDAELMGYHTSYDCAPSDHIVGYVGFSYRRR